MSLRAIAKRKYFCLHIEGLWPPSGVHAGIGMNVDATFGFPIGVFVIDQLIHNGLSYFISKLAAHQKRQIKCRRNSDNSG